MKHRLYLAGPMTGLPDYNRPAFNAMAAQLRAAGYFVVNPAENGLPADSAWIDHMRRDIELMMVNQCDGLALLPSWGVSKGANIEFELARALGFELMHVNCWLRIAKEEAAA